MRPVKEMATYELKHECSTLRSRIAGIRYSESPVIKRVDYDAMESRLKELSDELAARPQEVRR